MPFLFVLFGVGFLIVGGAVFSNTQSAIHEILGIMSVGFAVVAWGIAAVVDRLKLIEREAEMSREIWERIERMHLASLAGDPEAAERFAPQADPAEKMSRAARQTYERDRQLLGLQP